MHIDQTGFDDARRNAILNQVAQNASALGAEVVDIDGFLDAIAAQTTEQQQTLRQLREGAGHVVQVNASVMETLAAMSQTITQTLAKLTIASEKLTVTEDKANHLVSWVQTIDQRAQNVQGTLDAVQNSNNQIAVIAAQVNMLAINAKIEAARAGETGKGFAVVADAINELSQRTGQAAEDITGNVNALIDWISGLQSESGSVSRRAQEMHEHGAESGAALTEALQDMEAISNRNTLIARDAEDADKALREFLPNIAAIDRSVAAGIAGVQDAHKRITRLVDTSESLVQGSVALGGSQGDALFIDAVKARSGEIRAAFETALREGSVSIDELFDTEYRPVPGSNPEQVVTRFTRFTDRVLPGIIEPALDLDPRVVFCAAVDRNGYLPTHNRKFSQPQGTDPVWNTAHCRNRRIFDDRVGLKAGRNAEPFLLQVYRRDMGGGEFVLMKDVSAPIFVDGRHWGGLRLAYRF